MVERCLLLCRDNCATSDPLPRNRQEGDLREGCGTACGFHLPMGISAHKEEQSCAELVHSNKTHRTYTQKWDTLLR